MAVWAAYREAKTLYTIEEPVHVEIHVARWIRRCVRTLLSSETRLETREGKQRERLLRS